MPGGMVIYESIGGTSAEIYYVILVALIISFRLAYMACSWKFMLHLLEGSEL